jgi:hypothetical protein
LADRHCSNCGHELPDHDRFCPNCGAPVHEAAHVPTPEADVPVSPPPPQHSPTRAGFGAGFGASIGWILGGCLVTLVVVMLMFGGCAVLLAGSSG